MIVEGRTVEGLPSRLPEAARAYIAALPRGRFVGFNLAPLDRTGVPVWFVSLFLERDDLPGNMPSGIGYGATDDEAIIGAVAEIAENLLPTLALMATKRERASHRDLTLAHGAGAAVDPRALCLPAGSPVDRDTPLDWVEARRARDGAAVLLPMDVVAVDRFELSPGYEPFTPLITNGFGAGPDVEFALGHGLLECLQRDGNGLLFRALDQGVRLDLDGVGPEVRAMLDRLEALGIEAMPKFATDAFGLANVYVVGRDRPGHRPPAPIALSACGEACDPDRDRALRKALLEFQAARVRKSFSHGPLNDARRVAPPGYVDEFVARALPSLDAEEDRALSAMMDWAARPDAEIAGFLASTVYADSARKPFAELPTTAAPDGHARARVARARVEAAGFDVLGVDLSPPGRAVGVARAVVPGFEVETMSYHRVGERNARKLMERDHPLIRFGEATATLLPVRLTEEALARLGGRQPLFDTALADAIVGPLYPLYREPEAHHAHLRLEERAAAQAALDAAS